MIGGIDRELVAPPQIDLPELVARVCRRRWPEGVLQDADSSALTPLGSPALARHPPGEEFFVFSDRPTAEAWDELGPCPANWNRMLHFVCRPDATGQEVRVTVVIDELTPEMRSLLDDLQDTFREADYFAPAEVAA